MQNLNVVTHPISHSFCGDLVYTATINGASLDSNSTPVSFDQSNLQFRVQSDDPGSVGLYNIDISAHFADNSNYVDKSGFAIVVNITAPCHASTFTIDSNMFPSNPIEYMVTTTE